MENMLLEWVSKAKPDLERQGYSIQIIEPEYPTQGGCINLDSKDFVGGITYWKPDLFEFHFIDVQTEKDILLETVNLASVDALNSYVMKMLAGKLPLPEKNRP